MRKVTAFILVLAALACTKQVPADDFDVRLDIPSEMILESDAASLRFSVREGKAPKGTDVLLLAGNGTQQICTFTALTPSYVEIAGLPP